MKLRLKLDTSLAVIVACGVLHNIARKNRIPEPEVQEHVNNIAQVEIQPHPNPNQGGHATRERLIALFQ